MCIRPFGLQVRQHLEHWFLTPVLEDFLHILMYSQLPARLTLTNQLIISISFTEVGVIEQGKH